MRHSSRSTRGSDRWRKYFGNAFCTSIDRFRLLVPLAVALVTFYSWKLLSLDPSGEIYGSPCPVATSYSNDHLFHWEHQQQNLDFLCHDPAISFLKILNDSEPPVTFSPTAPRRHRPKILCLVLTQGSNHATRLEAIWNTWAKKCDWFIAASDTDDPSLHASHIRSEEGYWGIWDKLMQSLRMILEDKNHQQMEFDWILKADDDTYVIMENLRSFLWNETSTMMHNTDTPLIYGRTMPWPRLSALKDFGGWFEEDDKEFGDRFYERFPDKKQRLVYAHGGPGYVMNPAYVKVLTHAYFHTQDAIHRRVSEDLANAATMLYNLNMTPSSTMDRVEQKERSHPESPRTMYSNPNWLPWVQESIQNRGHGPDCCSKTSISYHHVSYREIRLLHYQLYECPNRHQRRLTVPNETKE